MLFDEKEERSAMKIFRKIRSAADDMKKAKYLKDFDACAGKTSDRQLMFMTKLMDKNEMEMFKMLITVRVEILTARDEDGWTILHSAVSQVRSSLIIILDQFKFLCHTFLYLERLNELTKSCLTKIVI